MFVVVLAGAAAGLVAGGSVGAALDQGFVQKVVFGDGGGVVERGAARAVPQVDQLLEVGGEVADDGLVAEQDRLLQDVDVGRLVPRHAEFSSVQMFLEGLQ